MRHLVDDDCAFRGVAAVAEDSQAVLRLERAAVLAAAAALLGSCGGGGGSASALPDCAGAAETIGRPEALPADFPVPEGTVFVGQRTSGRFSLVDARSPGDFDEVHEFFERELDHSGYQLSGGEAEEDEAETDFAGNGLAGHLVVHTIGGCDGAVRVGVATSPG